MFINKTDETFEIETQNLSLTKFHRGHYDEKMSASFHLNARLTYQSDQSRHEKNKLTGEKTENLQTFSNFQS